MFKGICILISLLLIPLSNCFCGRYYPDKELLEGTTLIHKNEKTISIYVETMEESFIKCEKISAIGYLFSEGHYIGQRRYFKNNVIFERRSILTTLETENLTPGVTENDFNHASVTFTRHVEFLNCDYFQLFDRNPILYVASSILFFPIAIYDSFKIFKSYNVEGQQNQTSDGAYPDMICNYDTIFNDKEDNEELITMPTKKLLKKIQRTLYLSSSESDTKKYCKELLRRKKTNAIAYGLTNIDNSIFEDCKSRYQLITEPFPTPHICHKIVNSRSK